MNFPPEIQERIIQIDFTILQSLKKMDAINKKLLLVFNKENFVGVLSIGDIQKAIIENLSLEYCLANCSFVFKSFNIEYMMPANPL